MPSSEKLPGFPRLPASIRFAIPAGVLIILGLALLIAGKILISEQRDRTLGQLETYGQDTAEFIAQISIIPIQKYSFYQLENYINQLVKGEGVVSCRIFDEVGTTLAGKFGEHYLDAAGVSPGEDVKVFTAQITSEGRSLGRVEITLDLAATIHSVNRTSILIGIGMTLTLLLVGVALSFFLHVRVVAPITRLAGATRKIAEGHFKSTSKEEDRGDEIGMLARSINEMGENLSLLYEELEERVAARTRELSEAKHNTEMVNRSLASAQAELQNLLDNSPVGIAFINSQSIIERVNPEFVGITGYRSEELVGNSTRKLYGSDEEYSRAREATIPLLQRDGSCQATVQLRRKDGEAITVSTRGRLMATGITAGGAVWSLEDITARLRMEGELLKIKNLESISVLTGGIAHDFNNILMAIVGNLSLGIHLADDPELKKLLASAKDASMRARELTNKLMIFAGTAPASSRPLFVQEVFAVALARATEHSNTTYQIDLPQNLWPISIDQQMLVDIITNLAENAILAMGGKGSITVSGHNIRIPDSEPHDLPRGPYVRLEFADTGHGIAEEIIGRIFDPYFSTSERSSKRGGGLGLAVVHTIITQQGGTISVS